MTARYDLSDEELQIQATLVRELNEEEIDPEDDVGIQMEEHPEGAKRGGYVPVYYGNGARAFYCTTACEWVPYDS